MIVHTKRSTESTSYFQLMPFAETILSCADWYALEKLATTHDKALVANIQNSNRTADILGLQVLFETYKRFPDNRKEAVLRLADSDCYEYILGVSFDLFQKLPVVLSLPKDPHYVQIRLYTFGSNGANNNIKKSFGNTTKSGITVHWMDHPSAEHRDNSHAEAVFL